MSSVAKGKRRATAVDQLSDDESLGNETKRVKLERYASEEEEEDEVRIKPDPADAIPATSDAEDEVVDDDLDSEVERDPSDHEDNINWSDQGKNIEAFQRVRREHGRDDDVVPQSGVIKSVRIVNFMNHKNFSYDNFGPKVNFIVGHNGSGKSAILTAIATVLGTRTTITGRGSGVKDLIHRGADKATITLTLSNRGPNAFQPEKYPEKIVIERVIERNGGGGYKFQADRDGPILERKRSELQAILSHFALNMDSPLTLLTQDNAKSFLASSDPRSLYDFFLKGSSLRQLSDLYDQSLDKHRKMVTDLQEIKSNLPSLRARMERFKRVVKMSQKLQTLQQEKGDLEKKLAWAYVLAKELEIAAVREKIEVEVRKVELGEDDIANTEAKYDALKADIERLSKEMATMQQQRAPTVAEIKKTRVDRENVVRVSKQLKLQIDAVSDDIRNKKREIDGYMKKLAESRKVADDGGKQQEVRENLKKLQNMRNNMQRDLPAKNRLIAEKQEDIDRATTDKERLERRRDEVRTELENARSRLANLKAQQTNPLAAYGTGMEILMREIGRARWREKPLGPLGQYIRLKDLRYKDLFQSMLGGLMCGFAVRYREDKDQLMGILQRCLKQGYRPGTGAYRPPQIMMHHGDAFDFSAGDLSRYGETLLSKLEVTDSTVLRLLITVVRVEQVFAAPDQDAGLRIIDEMVEKLRTKVVVNSADNYTQNGEGRNRGLNPLQAWRGNTLFARDTTQESSAMEEKVKAYETEHQALLQQIKEKAAAINSIQSEVSEASRSVRRQENGIRDMGRKINELEDDLVNLMPVAGDAVQLTLDDAEKDLGTMETEKARLEGDLDENNARSKQIEKRLEQLVRENEKFEPTLQEKKEAMHIQVTEQAQCHATKEHRMRSIASGKARIEANERQVTALEEELQDWTIKAARFCPRMEVTEPATQLSRRREAVIASIAEAEGRNHVNYDDAVQKFNKAHAELKNQEKNLRHQEALLKLIDDSCTRRATSWMMMRAHTAIRVTTVFTSNLATRGFEGFLNFDHDQELLKLRVNTSSSASAKGSADFVKSANRLSGGERSYATVCLLLALWDTSSGTIACLDEWDVFLDNVNRQLAGNLLMAGAKEVNGKQFILITPLDMGGMNVSGEHNKIIRLGDPERGQATLAL